MSARLTVPLVIPSADATSDILTRGDIGNMAVFAFGMTRSLTLRITRIVYETGFGKKKLIMNVRFRSRLNCMARIGDVRLALPSAPWLGKSETARRRTGQGHRLARRQPLGRFCGSRDRSEDISVALPMGANCMAIMGLHPFCPIGFRWLEMLHQAAAHFCCSESKFLDSRIDTLDSSQNKQRP